MLMETRQLAAFCAVVDHKSFSQAAERLGVTQPAVSLQVRSLEQRLGQRLLDRSGRRVEPTEAGLRLYQGAQRLLALESEVVEEVAGGAEGQLGGMLSIDELRSEPLIVMQEGAGVRQVIEDELREAGARLRDLDVKLELGLQESVKSAVEAGYGVTFISRSAVESELATGTLASARVKGLEPAREISLVRAAGRTPTRAASAFVDFAREQLA